MVARHSLVNSDATTTEVVLYLRIERQGASVSQAGAFQLRKQGVGVGGWRGAVIWVGVDTASAQARSDSVGSVPLVRT
jgi:hypothetical protein